MSPTLIDIDELRWRLGMNDRNVCSVVMLAGKIEWNDGSMVRRVADAGDRAYVFLGPKDALEATVTEEDGAITYTFRFSSQVGQSASPAAELQSGNQGR